MQIGELAGLTGVDTQTIRYYEREGLLDHAARQPSGYRDYSAHHLEQLGFIRHCRSLEIPLADIRRFLDIAREPKAPCGDVDELIDLHLKRVRDKLLSLTQLERQLTALRSQCGAGHQVADCGILEELAHGGHGDDCACHSPTK